MKIHKVELEHVRNIRQVSLDLSAPLTIIAGPMGVQKSTVQQAILAAMFRTQKKDRDSLISRFDPHSEPTAKLFLSRGAETPTITLSRILIDDRGEWQEGSTRIKQKGKALEMIQETLPISADAAVLLLWGRQEKMAEILEEFPSDGHSLLTNATVKGTGPDPKQVMDSLDNQFKDAKRRGKNPGSLTRVNDKVKNLEGELNEAQESQKQLEGLQKKFGLAKANRDQLEIRRRDFGQEVQHLDCLEQLLELEQQEQEWNTLDEQLENAQRDQGDLENSLNLLQAQYRAARDNELGQQIEGLQVHIKLVRNAEKKVEAIRKDLDSKKRPNESESEQLRHLQAEVNGASARMEASGLSYELSVDTDSQIVEISEDNAAPKQKTLTPDHPYDGIVGNVVIRANALRISASGKEDIAAHRRSIEQAQKKIQALFLRFGVKNDDEFGEFAAEKGRLEEDLKEAKSNVNIELKGKTLGTLKAELSGLEEARRQNSVTPQDKQICGRKFLRAASEIEKDLLREETKLQTAQNSHKELERNRPNDEQKAELKTELRTARREAEDAISWFKEDDAQNRDPTPELLSEIKQTLQQKRTDLGAIIDNLSDARDTFTGLAGDLKYAGPERPLTAIEADLEETQAVQHRESVFQDARELLRDRIQEKIFEMAESVPSDLAERISQNLTQLTNGIYESAHLTENLTLSSLRERSEDWKPHELSVGERTITALTVKIAVARSLAETSIPVFIILDDSLVNLDPQHRTATENLLLDLVADGKLQVILLTCHTDWAEDWYRRTQDGIRYIELAKVTEYYRTPAAIAVS